MMLKKVYMYMILVMSIYAFQITMGLCYLITYKTNYISLTLKRISLSSDIVSSVSFVIYVPCLYDTEYQILKLISDLFLKVLS